MTGLGRLWRTVRWLKPAQVIGRARFRLHRPCPDLRPAPPPRATAGDWVRPAAREPSLVAPARWLLLNEAHGLDEVGWDDPKLALLWRYNQHYFDDLNARACHERRAWQAELVARWIADNPPAKGTGWAPYPVSLRIVNWIKWWLGGQSVDADWAHSLAVQTRWLERRLEWHLLGNHLFVNAKALVFAGLWFSGAEAERWLATGLRILERELAEQILADGGQFERSPMYHALALEDLLDLLNVIQARAPVSSRVQALAPTLRQHCRAMLAWLRCMTHPSGSWARFNDSADGVAPAGNELERYCAALDIVATPALGEGVHWLQSSGYARVVRGAARALLDVAPIGPDYLPGHAHADTLSFELSLGARELIVNRGTSVYGSGARRQAERSTAAHSTLQLGLHDSSEVWSGFRVGRRARVRDVVVSGWRVSGMHDGYAHLAGVPLHRRVWTFEPNALVVEDQLTGRPKEPAVARLHLAPGLAAIELRPGCWCISDARTSLAEIDVEAGQASVEHWQHALGFGRLVDAQTLAVALADGNARVRIRWSA
jgi:uncharacterized heparinase superfamily protein